MHGNLLKTIDFVSQFDPEIGAMMGRELGRQKDGLELIASENFASPAVIAAMGIMTIFFIQSQNEKLYGKLDLVLYKYENNEDVSKELAELEEFAWEYTKKLNYFADEEKLEELYEAVITLKTLYFDSSEEFRTECARIRLLADRIYRREIPDIGRIL